MNLTDIVTGFRKALEDILVPEIKVIQTELKYLKERIDQVDKRIDQVDKKIDLMQEQIKQMQITQEKILDKLDMEKRITRLETLIEQILKKAA
jgi:chromosome segregation ATPase